MKNIYLILMFFFIYIFSCSTDEEKKKIKVRNKVNNPKENQIIQFTDSDEINDQRNNLDKELNFKENSQLLDSLNVEIKKNNCINLSEKDSENFPERFDYYSEVEIYYKRYINKAYSDSTYKQYFRFNREKLDSLITKYENRK